jgi:dimethylhistidine N-methyltransferase
MSEFKSDVIEGLSSIPKKLSSKYFYDERGDELFIQIMNLDEYYLTRSEYEILDRNKNRLLEQFRKGGKRFELVELGAGDGLKTKILLEHFVAKQTDFKYTPIDISENVLQILKSDLIREIPELNFEGISGDYFKVLDQMGSDGEDMRDVVLFLGSNIGNFQLKEAIEFLKKISNSLNEGDMLLIGFDLKKNPKTILNAYNDSKGVTKAFNLNLLHRINKELGADFDVEQFEHYPTYDPLTGETRSYLISQTEQDVNIDGSVIHFKKHEPVFVEISQKFSLTDIESLAAASGFEIVENYFDEQGYFVDSLWVCA